MFYEENRTEYSLFNNITEDENNPAWKNLDRTIYKRVQSSLNSIKTTKLSYELNESIKFCISKCKELLNYDMWAVRQKIWANIGNIKHLDYTYDYGVLYNDLSTKMISLESALLVADLTRIWDLRSDFVKLVSCFSKMVKDHKKVIASTKNINIKELYQLGSYAIKFNIFTEKFLELASDLEIMVDNVTKEIYRNRKEI
jgi:hypothetical protein